MKLTPKNIIVHHTASPRDQTTVQAVNNYHRGKDWGGGAHTPPSSLGWYVTYHYFIEANGKLTQCARDDEVRWHAAARNIDSIGICLAGWFDDGHDNLPTAAQVETLTKLLKQKCAQYNIPPSRVYPHRKFAKKSCYGYHLADDWAAKLVSAPTTRYQITNPAYLAKYKATDIEKLPDGRILLKPLVKPVEGTVKTITL